MTLVLLILLRITKDTIVQIWHIDDEYNERDRNKKSKILMSELKLNDEQLMDSNHGFLPMKRDNSDGAKRTLPVASSSLPIFKTTEVLHEHCLDLLHHCITVILGFVSANGSANGSTGLWCLREECFFLQQIYNYTVKLEDSFEAQQYHYEDSFDTDQYVDIDENSSTSSNSNNSIESNMIDDSFISDHSSGSGSESCESINLLESDADTDTSYAEIQLVKAQTPSRIRRLASALQPLFLRSNTRKDDERAIAEAASTFVTSGFKEISPAASRSRSRIDKNGGHDVSSVGSGSIVHDRSLTVDLNETDGTFTTGCGSVVEVISKAIISSIFTRSPEDNGDTYNHYKSCWNGLDQIAVQCNLLQCQNQNNDRDYELETSMGVIEVITKHACVSFLKTWYGQSESEEKFDSNVLSSTTAATTDTTAIDNQDVGCFLMAHTIQSCRNKWSSDDAKAIFDVMISMLARHKGAPNANIVLPILTLIAVASSHISGQSDILFGVERTDSSEVG